MRNPHIKLLNEFIQDSGERTKRGHSDESSAFTPIHFSLGHLWPALNEIVSQLLSMDEWQRQDDLEKIQSQLYRDDWTK